MVVGRQSGRPEAGAHDTCPEDGREGHVEAGFSYPMYGG